VRLISGLTGDAPVRQNGPPRFQPDPTAPARNLPASCRWTRRRSW